MISKTHTREEYEEMQAIISENIHTEICKEWFLNLSTREV